MKFTVITVFPDLIQAFLGAGLVGTAHSRGHIEVSTLNPRQFTTDAHQSVDDRAFGGSDGMVMKFEPLHQAIQKLRAEGPCSIYLLTPQGRPWAQPRAREFAARAGHVVLICGRYAGIDHRVATLVDGELSLGDYILNGGEVAACAIIESVARLRPGVLGNPASAFRDSFAEDGLLECPQFTRPREVEGLKVPAPLLSGHHREIERFEVAVSRVRTQVLRPDVKCQVETADLALVAALDDGELRSLGLTREQLSRINK